MIANAPMAESIWINRVSNLVRRITGPYGAARACSIAAIALCLALATAVTAGAQPLFCVLVPHFKDEYWLSVGFGLEQEAARQDVKLLFFEAGGYRAQARQIDQLQACADRGVDAILIGAVTSDHPDMIEAIDGIATSTPVVGLVNELHADALSGRIGVDWRDMGLAVGQFLADRHPQGSNPKTVIYVSGPPEAGWTGPLEAGLRAGLKGSALSILEIYGADTGLREQLALVDTALQDHPDADYLIGSAPAIEAGIGLITGSSDSEPPILVSTYISHTIMRGLMNGSVLAAPFDDPATQGVMALDQAMSVLATGRATGMVGPEIKLLTNSDPSLTDIRVSPAEYFPDID